MALVRNDGSSVTDDLDVPFRLSREARAWFCLAKHAGGEGEGVSFSRFTLVSNVSKT